MDGDLQRLWEAYVAAERLRIRTESSRALNEFIDHFLILDERKRQTWARELALKTEAGESEVPVRMPLFAKVLFPALLNGIEHSEPDVARCLACFSYLLHHAHECQERLLPELRTERGLVQLALQHDPDDLRARNRLVMIIASALEYAIHELPAGVLYGHDGATIEQCAELLLDLQMFKSHVLITGRRAEYEDLIEECELHFTMYRRYLEEGCPGGSYEHFFLSRSR